VDAAAFRHVARYSEHTHRSTVRHGGRAATARAARRAHNGRQDALLAADAGDGGWHAGALSVNHRAVPFLTSLAGSRLDGGWLCRRTRPGDGRYSNYVHPCAAEGRRIHIRRTEYTRLGLQGRKRVSSSPRPLIEAMIPRRCPSRTPASPQALLAQVSRRSSLDLAGKISVDLYGKSDAFYST